MSKFDKDPLGVRMKEYEDVTNYKLSRKSLILGRIDGNAFHTYTKSLPIPFDADLIADMDATAIYLCQEIQNCKFAYVQSDEISLFLHEDKRDTQPWFSNKLAKMNSIGASKATTEFNRRRLMRACFDMDGDLREEMVSKDDIENFTMAEFDARFWTVPLPIEVYNYFLWRQRDAEKNSISAAAQSVYSHTELENKNGLNKQEMLFQKGINWNDYPSGQKRGRFIEKITYINDRPRKIYSNEGENIGDQYQLDGEIIDGRLPDLLETDKVRTKWEVVECPIFSQAPAFILDRIQSHF